METPLETLVEQARDGDSDALERLVLQIQDRIYGLAMRMLWHPEDAEDATQEILVKIVTHLGHFRQQSAFSTWCYRIAANHLLSTRKRRAELMELTFDNIKDEMEQGMAYAASHACQEPEQELLAKEVMIGCIQGVMLCLDRPLRLTYLLGEIYGVDSYQGGEVLGISPEAFRKRLSRARTILRDFLAQNCGLATPSNACTCARQLPYALKTGLVNPRHLLFATHPCSVQGECPSSDKFAEADEVQRVDSLLRGPEYAAPNAFVTKVRTLIDSGNIQIFGTIH